MPKITATPDPVSAGHNLQICYTFGANQTGVSLTVRYSTPNDGDVVIGIELTPANPCYDRHVPSNCTGVLISDDSGAAEDLAVTVTP